MVQINCILLENSSAYKQRYQEIYTSHNFAKTRNQDAVPAAIDYIIKQEDQANLPMTYDVAKLHGNYHTNSANNKRPLCNVTYDAIMDDSTYVYLGSDAKAPYNFETCFAVIPQYHVAPVCEQREQDAGHTQLYQWKWTLNAAREGYCELPDYTPLTAAAQYLASKEARGEPHRVPSNSSRYPDDQPGKTVNILWLGLSFMGQPYLSLACRFKDLLSEESTAQIDGISRPLFSSIDESGHCAHTCDTCCNEALHPVGEGKMVCKSPTRFCQLEMLVFKSPPESKDPITVCICYQYTFNIRKNGARLYNKLPCQMQWSDVDVVFGLHHAFEFLLYFSSTKAPINHMPHVKVVLINFGVFESAISYSHVSHNMTALTIENFRGKPSNCDKPDIHNRMPGLPDFQMQVLHLCPLSLYWYSRSNVYNIIYNCCLV